MRMIIDIQDDVYKLLKEDKYPIPNPEKLAIMFKVLVKKGIVLQPMTSDVRPIVSDTIKIDSTNIHNPVRGVFDTSTNIFYSTEDIDNDKLP